MRIDNPQVGVKTSTGLYLDRVPGTYIQYDSYTAGHITGSSSGGSVYGSTYYDNQYNGMVLTNNLSQNGAVYWYAPNFDFSADWRFSFQAYLGRISGQTFGDGIIAGVGGSTFDDNPSGPSANGALKFRYYTYAGNSIGTGFSILNSQTVIGDNYGTLNWDTVWVDCSLENRVNRQTGKKTATGKAYYKLNIQQTLAGAETTNWKAAGGYVYIYGFTGGAGEIAWVRDIKLEYL